MSADSAMSAPPPVTNAGAAGPAETCSRNARLVAEIRQLQLATRTAAVLVRHLVDVVEHCGRDVSVLNNLLSNGNTHDAECFLELVKGEFAGVTWQAESMCRTLHEVHSFM